MGMTKLLLIFIGSLLLFLPITSSEYFKDPKAIPNELTAATTHKSKYIFNEPSNIKPNIKQARPALRFLPKDQVAVDAPSSSSSSLLAPSAPTELTVQVLGLTSIKVTWTPATGNVDYHVFGIGNVASGDYSTLANVRWWQVADADDKQDLSFAFDAGVTYYFSVYAVNPSGNSGPIATSGGFQMKHIVLGKDEYELTVAYSDIGYDSSGNEIAGWSNAQVTMMTDFAGRMLPIIRELYGPPSVAYTVTIVRDLYYSSTNIFIPSTDEIRKDDSFSAQLFTHELLHAFRNDHILASNDNWEYDPTLSGFEESFAQAVSYECMNRFLELHPQSPHQGGGELYGSSLHWNYDLQNMEVLRGTDFWSDTGGTGIFWKRYEVGAAAIRKIGLETLSLSLSSSSSLYPSFYRDFNAEYYRRINATPSTTRSSRGLMVEVIASIVPSIEGKEAAAWLDEQHVFYCEDVLGQKIFHNIQDYPTGELYVFHTLYYMETMACGSEWACWTGQGNNYNYHRLNGAQGSASLQDWDGTSVWSGPLSITPTINPPQLFEFGSVELSLTTADTLEPWPGGESTDYVLNLDTVSAGLYKFTATFTDPLDSNAATTSSFYRVLGSEIRDSFSGVWGGVLGFSTGAIYLDHEDYPPGPPLVVERGAFFGTRSWTGIPNPRTGGIDSAPGRVTVKFVSPQGQEFNFRRNIDYGSWDGGQMFLFDPTTPTTPTTPSTPSTPSTPTPTPTPTRTPSRTPTRSPTAKEEEVDCSGIPAYMPSKKYGRTSEVKSDNRLFKSRRNKNKGKNPGTAAAWWALQGTCAVVSPCASVAAWTSSKKYSKNQQAVFKEVLYKAKRNSKNKDPSNYGSVWTEVADC